MSIKEPSKKNKDFSDVDPIVSETLDSALGQLHLDDLEGPGTSSTAPESTKQSSNSYAQFSNVPPSHMFPHPQMFGMGFIPYSQMMPVPHHNGFFPPPESGVGMTTNTSGTIMFNNSNDASVFAAPPVPNSNRFVVGSINGDAAPTSNDPLWASSGSAQAVIEPLGASSSAIEDSTYLDEALPSNVPAAATATFRRQTFHALSPNDLINSATTETAIPASNLDTAVSAQTARNSILQGEHLGTAGSVNARAQSISMEKNDSNPIFSSSDSTDKREEPKLASDPEKDSGSSNAYAAAYPYGGPLLQPNPVLSGHHPPGTTPAYGVPSPFHGAYGFASPFQFSPAVGSPNAQLHPHSPFQLSPVGGEASTSRQLPHDPNSESAGAHKLSESSSTVQPPQVLPLSQHQQSGTPPPWMYGNHPFGIVPHPHAFPQGHPQMIHPNSSHQNEGHINHNSRHPHSGSYRGGRAGHYGNGKSKHNKNSNHQYYLNNGGDSGSRQRKMDDGSRYADATLDQFIGNIYSLCKDQHGCRFLQKQLDILGSEAAGPIFEETRVHTVELMTDSFGNYLIQKLLERVDVQQRIALARIAAPHFVYIASNPHGTRALQKLVECIDTKEEAQIVISSLKDSVVDLSKDLNGNHIVQKCLQKLQPEDVQFIFDAASEHFTEIATHRHGCCVLQRCLDHGDENQRRSLCSKLLSNIDHLTLDPFGNYVVQYIITKETEQGNYHFTHKIVQTLKPDVTELSLHKFGSNVVEKILRTPVVSEVLIRELLNARGEADIQVLLNDGYGNYVLQTMLDVTHQSNQSLHKSLVDIVRPLLVGPIRNTPHGRRIMGILRMDQ